MFPLIWFRRGSAVWRTRAEDHEAAGRRPRARSAIEVFAWDTELKGFGVRMMPSGVASYVLKYQNAEGRQRKLALGRVGQLTPDEARRLAREKLGDVARGADPSAERRGIREAVTVAELCDLYLEAAAGRVKSSTLVNDRSHLERHVKPLIGRRAVVALTHDDVVRLHSDITAGKTARPREGRGGETRCGRGVAARTIVMFGGVLEFRNDTGGAASCLCVLTPGVLGPEYFREIAAQMADGAPDPAKMKEIMLRRGLVPVPAA